MTSAQATALQGQRVTVLGAGLSGRGAARLARRLGAQVVLTDQNPEATPMEGVDNHMGGHRAQDLTEVDLLVVSPGVPPRVAPVQAALAAGVEVVGELGFAHRYLPEDIPFVAVTGTNGKSSVVSFIGQLFEAAGVRAFVGGNLGTPLSDAVGGDFEVAVVEVSSYQLELPGGFRADAAAILNLSPDHLARHGTMRAYAEAKAGIFDRMRPDALALVPHGDALLIEVTENKPGRRGWLGAQPGLTAEGPAFNALGALLELETPGLIGQVSRWNAAVACTLAMNAGAAALSQDQLHPEALRALPHRFEVLGEREGVTWINDSKATNVDAASAGITGLDRPAVVLLGGQGKAGADYGALRAGLSAHARAVICFGASGDALVAALDGLPLHRVGAMAEAVERARTLAQPGDAVLLASACASFDEFRNFEERGEVFTRLALSGGE